MKASSILFPPLMLITVLSVGGALLGCSANPNPDQALANPKPVLKTQTGLAVFYDAAFQGEPTASGEGFNNNELVAAHPSYPVGTVVRVTNLRNGRAVEVRINDRGPTAKS